MKMITVHAGEQNVFVELRTTDGQSKYYPIITSEKKNTAQMGKPEILPPEQQKR